MSLYDYTALYKQLSLFQGSFLIGSAGFKCKSANTTKTVLDEVKFTLLEKKKKVYLI